MKHLIYDSLLHLTKNKTNRIFFRKSKIKFFHTGIDNDRFYLDDKIDVELV